MALTGIHGATARGLLRRLEEDDRYERIVLVDVRAPSRPIRRARFHGLDLTEPLADAALADVLRREEVDTVVHLAFREAPGPNAAAGHELETVGTMVVLNAAADCGARGARLSHLIAVTTSMVYGAHPRNPNYLTEGEPLRGEEQSGFVRDKVDVERQLAEFRREEGLSVCVLRPCWTLGARDSIASRLLRQPAPVTVLGFDPLIQLLHEEDLIEAVKRAVDRPRDGVFNLAGDGVLPLSAVLRLAGRRPLPLPAPMAYPTAELLWRTYGLGPGVSLDYLRYLWLVDDEAARSKLGFAPRHGVAEVVASFAAP